jgi:natural resistance-associated macrophage protein
MTNLNDVLNAVMSIQLPFAIIPALCFSSSRLVMGDFR